MNAKEVENIEKDFKSYFVKALGFSLTVNEKDGSGYITYPNGDTKKASTVEMIQYLNLYLLSQERLVLNNNKLEPEFKTQAW